MRATMPAILDELAYADPRVFFMTGDISGFMMRHFAEHHPGRYYNMGCSEANIVGVAAGLAMSGELPYIFSITPFISMRCYEQIRVDLCYQRQPVRILSVGSGFEYSTLGYTHHAYEDLAIMRVLPNMTVMAPATLQEFTGLMRQTLALPGPAYLRIARIPPESAELHLPSPTVQVGVASVYQTGDDISLICTGTCLFDAWRAAMDLADRGIRARVVSMHTVQPIDRTEVLTCAETTSAIVTIEEHNVSGGLGSAVAEILAETASRCRLHRLGVRGVVDDYGSHAQLRHAASMSPEHIVRTAIAALGEGPNRPLAETGPSAPSGLLV